MHPDHAVARGWSGALKMSKSKGNYVGITNPANTMFAKLLSISDTLMWRYFTLLSFRSDRDRGAQNHSSRRPQPEGSRKGPAREGDLHPVSRRCRGGCRATRLRPACARRRPRSDRRRHPLGRAACDRHRAEERRACAIQQRGAAPGRWQWRARRWQRDQRQGASPGAGCYIMQVGKRRFARVTIAGNEPTPAACRLVACRGEGCAGGARQCNGRASNA